MTSKSAQRVEAQSPLPAGVTEAAFREYARVQRHRIEKLYNRSRAVFAEFLVAQLLPGSTVSTDPAAAWDVTWTVNGRRLRIEVKCSGEYLPRKGYSYRTKPLWKFPVPRSAFDPDSETVIHTGKHNFDVLVLARHVGTRIDGGWTYHVLSTMEATALNGSAASVHLAGHPAVRPDALAAAVRRAADIHQ